MLRGDLWYLLKNVLTGWEVSFCCIGYWDLGIGISIQNIIIQHSTSWQIQSAIFPIIVYQGLSRTGEKELSCQLSIKKTNQNESNSQTFNHSFTVIVWAKRSNQRKHWLPLLQFPLSRVSCISSAMGMVSLLTELLTKGSYSFVNPGTRQRND